MAITNEMMQEREQYRNLKVEIRTVKAGLNNWIKVYSRIERSHQGTLNKKHLQEVKLSIAISNKNKVIEKVDHHL